MAAQVMVIIIIIMAEALIPEEDLEDLIETVDLINLLFRLQILE
jgi:hypothetical protein